MSTARSAGFALFCALVMGAILVPAARAQRAVSPNQRVRAARTVAERKIDPRVLAAIYQRRGGDRAVAARGIATHLQVDRHGRAYVDVRAPVRPELEKKIKALGGLVLATNPRYDSIVGWMPLLTLERLAADPSVRAIAPAL